MSEEKDEIPALSPVQPAGDQPVTQEQIEEYIRRGNEQLAAQEQARARASARNALVMVACTLANGMIASNRAIPLQDVPDEAISMAQKLLARCATVEP